MLQMHGPLLEARMQRSSRWRERRAMLSPVDPWTHWKTEALLPKLRSRAFVQASKARRGPPPYLLALRVSIVAGQGLKTKRLAPNRRWLRARYRRVENLKADKSAQLVSRLPWVATPSVVALPRVQ